MKVSCIIPSYNRPEQLLKRIEEIASQPYKDYEIIIVNDGSTKNYDSIKSSKNITYIELKENSMSVSIPRAIGISYATGKYIAHIDDDIPITKDRLVPLVDYLESNPDKKLAFGDRLQTIGNISAVVKKEYWDPTAPMGWGVDGCQFIYKADVYKDIPYVFCRTACDYETAKAIGLKFGVSSLGYVNCITANYIFHESNRSREVNKNLTTVIYPRKYITYFNKYKFSIPETV